MQREKPSFLVNDFDVDSGRLQPAKPEDDVVLSLKHMMDLTVIV